MRIEGGSQGGDNLEILGGYNQSFWTLKGGGQFFCHGVTDKENALSVSVSVSAATVFYIRSFTDTAQPYFEWCKNYISPKDFNVAISKAPK